MQKLRVDNFTVSLDGFGAGPNQTLNNPLGIGGTDLHHWMFATHFFQQMIGDKSGSGEKGVDNDFVSGAFDNVGAWILGRNMFGPIRGNWPDDKWKGWWGTNPPYHCPVFVLTHHPRESIVMEGGTVFHFITEGIEVALQKAKQAANGRDVRVGGGVSTLHQYLKAGLIDEMHLAIVPVLLGSGEKFFGDIDLLKLGYKCTKHVTTSRVMHVTITKTK
jgi:dihydrofolate reductase